MSRAAERLIASWSGAAASVASEDVAFVRALRERGRLAFDELGLPHTRLEEWRHTSLAALERVDWAAPDGTAATPDQLPELSLGADVTERMVIVDGRVSASLSTPNGPDTRMLSIASARSGGSHEALLAEVLGQLADPKVGAFTALNTALIDDGALIEIRRNENLEQPLHVVFAGATERRLHCPRLAVIARTGSRAVLVVDHVTVGEGLRLTNLVAEVILEPNAHLDLVFIQREGDEGFLFTDVHTRQSSDARLAIHTLSVGGRLIRNSLTAVLADPGAEVDMRGLFVGNGDRHIDNHTVADHATPHTTSREIYKGILGGASRGVFCGRVIVRPDAQKTDSSQSNPNLLLTPRAEIDTQPQLEIYADDVKCSHGSTIGRLDEDALFYLQSRGIGLDEGRVLLTRGFASEILEALPGDELRRRVGDRVATALEAAIPDAIGGSK